LPSKSEILSSNHSTRKGEEEKEGEGGEGEEGEGGEGEEGEGERK
jgi:hypothetical protein